MSNNQFLMHFRPSWLDIINTIYYKLKGSKIGANSYVMFGAKIDRFPKNVCIGENVIIKPNAIICSCNENAIIEIGNNVTIGNYTFIYSSKKIEIRNNIMIAPFCYIVDSNHNTKLDQPMIFQKNIVGDIVINNDVWIGQGSTILLNTEISEGSVIGSNSLVNKNTLPGSINVGIPSKQIATRE